MPPFAEHMHGSTRKIDPSEFFGGIAFAESDLKSPGNCQALSDDAKMTYAAMQDELSRSVAGNAMTRYAKLVRAVAQDSIMPFHEALAPFVFGQANS